MTKSPHPSSEDKGELLPTMEDRKRLLEIIALWTLGRKEDALQEVARHRQAHSLTGDVGMREALDQIISDCNCTINQYERNGPGYTSTGTGIEYEYASFVQNKMHEIRGVALAALTPSAPEPVQKLHELPEGHRWCRHCEQKDPHCSVCEGVGYLPNTDPSALSGDALREAIEWLREGPDQLAEDMDTAIFKERLRQSKDARGWCGQPILNIVADALAARKDTP